MRGPPALAQQRVSEAFAAAWEGPSPLSSRRSKMATAVACSVTAKRRRCLASATTSGGMWWSWTAAVASSSAWQFNYSAAIEIRPASIPMAPGWQGTFRPEQKPAWLERPGACGATGLHAHRCWAVRHQRKGQRHQGKADFRSALDGRLQRGLALFAVTGEVVQPAAVQPGSQADQESATSSPADQPASSQAAS